MLLCLTSPLPLERSKVFPRHHVKHLSWLVSGLLALVDNDDLCESRESLEKALDD